MLKKKKPDHDASRLVIWDRVLAELWNSNERHVRAVRLQFSGGHPPRDWDLHCEAACRCPRAKLRAGE